MLPATQLFRGVDRGATRRGRGLRDSDRNRGQPSPTVVRWQLRFRVPGDRVIATGCGRLVGRGEMATSEQADRGTRRRRDALVVLAGWLVIAVGLAAITPEVAGDARIELPFLTLGVRRLTELWLLLGLLGVTFRGFPSAVVERSAGRPGIILVVMVAGLAVYGQYGPTADKVTYPFVQWGMYSSPVQHVGYLEFRMLRGGDDAGRLPIADVAPTTSPRAFESGLASWVNRASQDDDEAVTVIEDVVHWVLEAEELGHVDVVRIDRCAVSDLSADPVSVCNPALEVAVQGSDP